MMVKERFQRVSEEASGLLTSVVPGADGQFLRNLFKKKLGGCLEIFSFFPVIPFYLQSVLVHSANCVNNV
jgi:hypothetical protein